MTGLIRNIKPIIRHQGT